MEERILAKLRELRGEDFPAMLAFAARRSVEMMGAYCNRETLPEELLGVGVALAGWLLDSGLAEGAFSQAKSIREGDVSITFQEGGTGEAAGLPTCFRMELNRWRRLDW